MNHRRTTWAMLLLDLLASAFIKFISKQPSVAYCAEALHLSPSYFGNLVKKTGSSAQGYIQSKVIKVAEERLFDVNKSTSEIAHELGIKYSQHFTRLFK
jgi:AraC family transcriptional activator of pobA